ncbi:MAG: orotate phosphoribosyltransferase [Bacilli bacterium]|nr:orotate phosphoribosyltransferase [Bacilli bacterium]
MKTKIAKDLLTIKAVTLSPSNPYTWASGIKSPIYCDNRLTLSYPDIRNNIAEGLADIIKTNYSDAEAIIGTATAGIPHAAIVATILNLPMSYVRTKSKQHGKKNQIEGKLIKGQKVVVIEDLISTGKSVLEVVKTLKEVGCVVLGVVAIFTYNFEEATLSFNKMGINYKTLTDYETLIDIAIEEDYIHKEELKKLKAWRQDPHNISWMN